MEKINDPVLMSAIALLASLSNQTLAEMKKDIEFILSGNYPEFQTDSLKQWVLWIDAELSARKVVEKFVDYFKQAMGGAESKSLKQLAKEEQQQIIWPVKYDPKTKN
jgi:hypothetical protein